MDDFIFCLGWPNNPQTGNVDIVITGSSSANVLLPNDGGSLGQRVIGVLGDRKSTRLNSSH